MKGIKRRRSDRKAIRECQGKMSRKEKKKRTKEMRDAYDKQ